MRKPLKIILSILTALTGLVLVTALCLPFLIDPNDFKAEIEAAVKEQTGRTLTINGNLKLSIFPWLGITTGQIKLSNAQGFSEPHFAQIQQSELNVKLIPLLSKQLDVSEIVFKGLRLHLSKNKQGITNWDDLKSEKKETKNGNPLAILAIAGLVIDDAAIIWDDLQSGQHIEIKDMRLKVDKLTFNQQVPITLSFKAINKQPALNQLINFSGGLIVSDSLQKFYLKDIKLNINSKGVSIPTGELNLHLFANAMLDKTAQHFQLSDLKLSSGELKISAKVDAYLKEQAQIKLSVALSNFNIAKFLNKMEVKLPKRADDKALNDLELAFKLQANSQQLKIDDINIKLDETTLKGTVEISDFADPAITFNLALDRINADRYLPPKDKNKTKDIATPASAAAIGASLFPVETLRKLNATGQIVIEELKINDLKMQGLTLKLDAKEGIVQGRQDIKQFYEGSYQGGFKLNVNPAQPVLSLNEQLNNIQLEPLLEDIKGESKMTGSVNISAKLTGHGNTRDAIKSSLKGQLSFVFKNGIIKGFNIQSMIDKGKALIKGTPMPENHHNNQSTFSKISATANISDGLVQTNDLLALSSKIRVSGSGNASLMTDELNYQLKAIRIKQKATADSPEVLSSQPIFINVTGTFDKPKPRLDIAKTLLAKNKDKIDKVLDSLDENLPEKVEDFLKKFF
ncbi:MAG: AsmA family protein [Methylococcaceae bacterium]|nr:AsmA family protein [Methylococcaceae bacterium]